MASRNWVGTGAFVAGNVPRVLAFRPRSRTMLTVTLLIGAIAILLLASILTPAIPRSGTGFALSTLARESAQPLPSTVAPATLAPPTPKANEASGGAGQVLLAKVPVGFGPELPAFDPTNGWIYVSNGG